MSPRISVLTTVYDPDREHLEQCIASVRAQGFDDYEHVIVDDGSTRSFVTEVLTAAAETDPRVRLIHRGTNGGIVAASSDALEAAEGELIALLDHDDMLEPDALASMSAAVTDDVGVAYSDHDLIRPDGRYVTPSYKPDFSPERLRCQNYITHLLVARRSLVEEVGGFRDGFDGAQDHDLVLRLTERSGSVAHVPRILYHWRQSPRSVTTSADNKPWAFEAGARAVTEHCERIGIDAVVESTANEGCYRVRRRATEQPLVSVIIPTRGSSGRVWGTTRCFVTEAVRSLIELSDYQELEFVVVYDTETPDAVLRHLRDLAAEALTLVAFDGPFNFSAKINLGATKASGDLLLLLNDDTELIEPGSLGVLVSHLQSPDVAMVGAKLLFSDGTLQHAGHLYNHDVGHACFGWGAESPGPWPLRPLAVDREVSGVTAAAALVRRSAFEQVGGFATELPLNYNDVDFSLKLRAVGHRIVWSPWAVWYHFESRTRHSVLRPDEYEFINLRWHYEINNDPYYNPNLAPDRNDWLERPLRSGAPAIETRPNAVQRLLARATAARRGAGVNVIGYFGVTSGLGDRARELADALRAAGVEVSEWNVDRTISPQADVVRASGDDAAIFDTTIAVVTAPQLPGLSDSHAEVLAGTRKLIGYWFWELAEVPAEHRYGIDLVDEIWAPTRFVRDAYRAATDKPVRLAPLPIPEPMVGSAVSVDDGVAPFETDRFTFLTSFDHLSVMERKNPTGVIEAFRRGFPNGDEPVALVVKSINGKHRPDAVGRLAAAASADPRVAVLDEHLPHSSHMALIADAGALVSLHRSEGLGLHIADAMWLGTPVISTRYSGSLDITDDEFTALVDAALVPVTNGDGAYPEQSTWAEPDLDQAATWMRKLVDDPELCGRLGASARQFMLQQPSEAEAGRRLADLLGHRRARTLSPNR